MSIITSSQIRAARGLLRWKQKTMASMSGVGVSVLRDIEKEDKAVPTISGLKIRKTIEDAGVELIENDGVARRHDTVKVHRGVVAQDMIYDMFEKAVENKSEPVFIVCKSWENLSKFLGLNDKSNCKRFELISKHITVNCLLSDSDHIHEQNLPFKFRVLYEMFIPGTCHCVIDNKYVSAEPENEDGYMYLIRNSVGQRECFINQYKPAWEKAVPIHTASNDANESILVTAI